MNKNLILVFILLFISGCSLSNKNSVTTSTSYSVPNTGTVKKQVDTISNGDMNIDLNSSSEQNTTVVTPINHTVALIVPSKQIGKYYQETVNTINTYLIYKGDNYNLEVFDIVNQNKANMLNAIEKIKESNITKVLAMVTPEFLMQFNEKDAFSDLKVYFPIVNIYDTKLVDEYKSENFLFGGISYKRQIDFLLKDKKYTNLVELYDDSIVGDRLHLLTSNYKLKYSKKVDDNNRAYKYFLKSKRLEGSVLILNTPIVKSSILLSQIRALDIKLDTVLSTQLNYTPLILSLTQKEDRRNVFITNAIGKIPLKLKETNSILDNNLEFNWVGYSIILGMEYLTHDLNSFKDIKVDQNQILYPLTLYKVRQNSFKKIR